ncbi:MAG: hypothetical protein ACO2OR_04975 [Desulfurococcaceae archaeon]|jgi:hypothetical protein
MPKSLTETLKRELSIRELELLDIYTFKKKDVLRILDKKTSRVLLYETTKKISSLASIDEVKTLVAEVTKILKR